MVESTYVAYDPHFPEKLTSKISKLPKYSYEEVEKHNTKDDCWIIIFNLVYDVTDWVPKHPGGDIIYQYGGADCTDVFLAFHLPGTEKKRFGYCVGEIEAPRKVMRVQKSYRQLREKFIDEGLFKTNVPFYILDNLYCLVLGVLAYFLCSFGKSWGEGWLSEGGARVFRMIVGGSSIGFFMHQTGALLHDSLHAQLCHNIKADNFWGWLYGCVVFGISSAWWKDNHNKHHAYPNCLNDDGSIKDQQQDTRPFFVQFPTIIPFVKSIAENTFIRIQHITFLPVVWLAGRYAIMFDAYVARISHTWDQLLGIAIHWTWVLYLLSYADSYTDMALTYLFVGFAEGVLHLQLEMNHFCKPMEMFNLCKETDFFTFQCVTARNVKPNLFPFEWRWHGGLHLQIEHHLFPLMPRHNLHKISNEVEQVCKKHRVPYDMELTFPEAIYSI